MTSPLVDRLRDAGGATGRFLGRLAGRGWLTLAVLGTVTATAPVAATVAYGVRPPGGITRALAREAPDTLGAVRPVPELGVIPAILAVVVLAALYAHSVAETALVRALRGGGPGVVRTLGVGGRLFGVRVLILVAVAAVLAAVGAAAGRLVADPVEAVRTAVVASGPVLTVLVPLAVLADLLAVEAAVPAALGDREPERDVPDPEPPETDEWGASAWWRVRSGRTDRPGRTGSRDRVAPRGVLAAWGGFWRAATRDRGPFVRFLAVRVALEAIVWVLTGIAFWFFVLVAALLALVVTLVVVFLVSVAGAPVWLVALGFLGSALLALGALVVLTGLVHAPLRAYVRYYGMLVVGDLAPDFDAVPERRSAIRAMRDREADEATG